MTSTQLTQAIESRTAHTAVIGLGYVGIPFVLMHAEAGYQATGIDVDSSRVNAINQGRSPIETCTDAEVGRLVQDGRLRATTAFEAIAGADIVAICVPTPLTVQRDPDVGAIRAVLEAGRSYWRAGQLVLLESTTFPGTTNEIIAPFFRSIGLTPGEDIFLAFAPERIDPGNTVYARRDLPGIVGGLTENCGRLATAFYEQVMTAPVTRVSSPQVAEMAKLFENVFRGVNISLVNELAQLCDRMNIDIWEVIAAAKTKPYGFMPFYPGPGIGGHCIPVDPVFLSWKAREYGFTTRFIDLSDEINNQMPDYVAQRALLLMNQHGSLMNGARVLVLGMAFKRDVSDTRDSASIAVAERILAMGAHLTYHDPHVPSIEVSGTALRSEELTPTLLAQQDLVIITTDHTAVDYGLVATHARLIYDTRNALQGYAGEHIRRLGAGRQQ